MNFYAEQQGRKIHEGGVVAAMSWSEPSRDVKVAREQSVRLLAANRLHCVWTGRALSVANLDVDHCFPRAAWPCGDLWNLMPTRRDVNQNQKRDKLPGVDILRSAQDRIQEWWEAGYLKADEELLPDRFIMEARATLPLLGPNEAGLDDVFAALTLQQARLKYDQQVPVWEPGMDRA
jgi:hypothetical protein